jgi:hypothetical protein
LVNNALDDAVKQKGSASSVTPDDVKAAYETEIRTEAKALTEEFKQGLSDSVGKSLEGTPADVSAKSAGKALLDKMVDDPAGAQADLNAEATDIETKNPDWKTKLKDTLKDGGAKLLSYGGKALLVLAVCGALIPGVQGPLEKLANLAGEALQKVVTVAANILASLFGPLIKSFWSFIKSLKVPLIIIGIIIVILIIKSLLK